MRKLAPSLSPLAQRRIFACTSLKTALAGIPEDLLAIDGAASSVGRHCQDLTKLPDELPCLPTVRLSLRRIAWRPYACPRQLGSLTPQDGSVEPPLAHPRQKAADLAEGGLPPVQGGVAFAQAVQTLPQGIEKHFDVGWCAVGGHSCKQRPS